MKKKIISALLATMMLATGTSSVTASASSGRATYYRGSFLMWTRDNVDFSYTGKEITSSNGYQQAGWVFPNISRNNGITRYSETSKTHKWRGENTIGAGVPTPWGDVTVYNSSFIHRLVVKSDGSWYSWSD